MSNEYYINTRTTGLLMEALMKGFAQFMLSDEFNGEISGTDIIIAFQEAQAESLKGFHEVVGGENTRLH